MQIAFSYLFNCLDGVGGIVSSSCRARPTNAGRFKLFHHVAGNNVITCHFLLLLLLLSSTTTYNYSYSFCCCCCCFSLLFRVCVHCLLCYLLRLSACVSIICWCGCWGRASSHVKNCKEIEWLRQAGAAADEFHLVIPPNQLENVRRPQFSPMEFLFFFASFLVTQ